VRVAWLLEEIGAPYEPVSLSTAETTESEHLARHPLGRVPVLETDEGELLFESTAICLDLGDRYPEAGVLAPVRSRDRALVYQWSVFAMTELEPAILEFARHSDGDPERAAAGADRFGAGAAVLERALDGREFLVADHLTVADVVTGGVLGLAARRGLLPAPAYPSVNDYVSRLIERPAFRRAVAATESSLAQLIA